MESLDRYARGLDRLAYSVIGLSAALIGMGVLALLNGKASWALLPIFVGLPVASVLVIMGRREAYMAKSAVGFCVAFVSLGVASLIVSLD